jgi:hypothetical protein
MTLTGTTVAAQSFADDVTTQTDFWHQPAVGLIAAGIAVAGLFVAIISLRNSRLWLLQVTGRRAPGVVRNSSTPSPASRSRSSSRRGT